MASGTPQCALRRERPWVSILKVVLLLPLACEVGQDQGSRERLLQVEMQMRGAAGVLGCWGLSLVRTLWRISVSLVSSVAYGHPEDGP